jgi:predicted PurR-regulated permease PerM
MFCGLEDPLLCGAVAFLLKFRIGSRTDMGCIHIPAGRLVVTEHPWETLLPAGLYLAVDTVEDEILTPMLAITKIIGDRIRPLVPFGHFIEG